MFVELQIEVSNALKEFKKCAMIDLKKKIRCLTGRAVNFERKSIQVEFRLTASNLGLNSLSIGHKKIEPKLTEANSSLQIQEYRTKVSFRSNHIWYLLPSYVLGLCVCIEFNDAFEG